MYPLAQTKTNNIIAALIKLTSRSTSNRFKLRDFEREAKAIVDISPVEGYTVLGAIACMEHDNISMRKYHKIAIECSENSSYAIMNYGISLTLAFYWEEALTVYKEAFQKHPFSKDMLEFLISANYKLGLIEDTVALIAEWNKLSPTEKHHLEKSILDSREFLKTLPINQDHIRSLLANVASELTSTDIIMSGYRFNQIIEDEHRFLNCELIFQDPDTDISQVETSLENIISDKANNDLMEHFSITFCTREDNSSYDSFEMADESISREINQPISFDTIKDLIKDVEPL